MNIELRVKINQYIKSQKDISELIKGVDLRNEDLSHAMISNFNVSNQDISGCRLVGAKISHAQMIKTIAHNVQFNYCDMSYSNCSYIDARDGNFLNANCAYVIFKYADLRSCNFCNVTMTLSPKWAYKAKFSKNMIDLLKRIWDITDDDTEAKLCEEDLNEQT
jgi:uncharacterized protein YjbI with pentapeptide repeats